MTTEEKRYWYELVRTELLKKKWNFGFMTDSNEILRLYMFCSALMIEDRSKEITDHIKTLKFEHYRSYPDPIRINISIDKNLEEIYVTIKRST